MATPAEEFLDGSSTAELTTGTLQPLLAQSQQCENIWITLENLQKQMEERSVEIVRIQKVLNEKSSEELAMNGFPPGQLESYLGSLQSQMRDMASSAFSNRQDLAHQLHQSIELAAQTTDHLINVELHGWKLHQKQAQIGPKAKQQNIAQELDQLDPIFEQCGHELKKLRQIGELLHQNFIDAKENMENPVFDQLQEDRKRLHNLIYQMIWESCVIAKQPPPVLMKTRPPQQNDSGRRPAVRLSNTPVVRLLGGTSLGCRVENSEEVRCELVTEEQAKNVQLNNTPAGELLNNKARFESDSKGRFFATFSRNIQLVKLERPAENSESVLRQRYYLWFLVRLTVGLGSSAVLLQGVKLSLPVAAVVHPRQEFDHGADAFIFWDLAFSEGLGILTPVPRERSEGVSWPVAERALDLKFRQLVEGGKDDVHAVCGLSDIAIAHLAHKFFGQQSDYSRCRLTWEHFFQKELPNIYTEKNQRCTFRKWFYQCADVVNKHLLAFWNQGLILGFARRETAEQLLMQAQQAMMLIKFSDSQLSCLIISYFIPGVTKLPQHLKIQASDLVTVPLDRAVMECEVLAQVHHIYPNQPKTKLLAVSQSSVDGSSRQNSRTDPYAKKMVIGLTVEKSAPEWEPPTPVGNLDLEAFCDWLQEQEFPREEEMQSTLSAQLDDMNLSVTHIGAPVMEMTMMQNF